MASVKRPLSGIREILDGAGTLHGGEAATECPCDTSASRRTKGLDCACGRNPLTSSLVVGLVQDLAREGGRGGAQLKTLLLVTKYILFWFLGI